MMRYVQCMRTTVDLQPEALAIVKMLSRQKGKPVGIIISEIILQNRAQVTEEKKNGIPIFTQTAGKKPDITLINRLRDNDDLSS